MHFKGSRVLITGGLGFIGSNLAIRLVGEGAVVTVADSSVPGCGANPFNLDPVWDRVRVIHSDIAEPGDLKDAIRESQVVFNLAGEISHIHSMQFPERDLQINTVAQLRFLLECARSAPGVRIVYASTRQIYGIPDYLPIDERHPIQPVDFNGVHKYAASMYHLMLARSGQLDSVVLRLTNVYGPRMALNVPCQGFLSTFLRRLLMDKPIEVFGDGLQLRDPMYVDDAVEAFMLAGSVRTPTSRAFNVGGPGPLSIADIATMASRAAGGQEIRFLPFPEERRAIDIGSYATDSTRIQQELGWKPQVRFEEGIARTLAFYRDNLTPYLDPDRPEPACQMPEHSGALRRLTYSSL